MEMWARQLIFVLVLGTLLGLIPAAIAKSKGRDFVGFWIYGALLFIIALPHALFMKSTTKSIEQKMLSSGSGKRCPYCAEIIKTEASACRFCGREVK